MPEKNGSLACVARWHPQQGLVERHWFQEVDHAVEQALGNPPHLNAPAGWVFEVHPETDGVHQHILIHHQETAPVGKDTGFFSLVFEHASIGMAVLDLDGRWLEVNAALCRMLGYSRQRLMELTFQDITHPDDLETDLGYVKLLLEGKIETYELVKRYLTRFGEVLWIKLNVSLLLSPEGKAHRFVAQIQDITESITHQDHLQDVNAQLENTHRLARVASFRVDLRNNTITFSHSVKHLLGHFPGTLSVDQLSGWFTREAYRLFLSSLGECKRHQKESEVEVAFLSPASRRWVCRCFPARGEYFIHGMVQDVTLQRQQEQKYRDLEARWKLAVDSNQDGLWDWDVQTGTVFYSARWKEILGFEDHEVQHTDQEWRSRVHPEDLAGVEEAFMRHVVGRSGTYQAEYRMRHKQGQWIWVSERGTVVSRNLQGQALRVVGTLRDVTSRRLAEQQAQQARRDLQATIDHVPAMMGYWDRDLRMRFANQAYLDHFGVTFPEIQGKTMLEVIGEENHQHNHPHAIKALQGEIQHFQRDLHHKNSKVLHTQAAYIPDVQGNEVQGFFVLFTDVSPLVKLQKQLEDREAHFRLLAENATDMISLHRENGVCVYVSPYSETLLGYLPKEMEGRSIYEFVHPEDLPALARQEGWQYRGENRDEVFSYRFLRKDGKAVWVETSTHLKRDPETGRVLEVQASTRDITERKQTEQQLQRSLQYANTLMNISRLADQDRPAQELALDAIKMLAEVTQVDWAGLCEIDPLVVKTTTVWTTPQVPQGFLSAVERRPASPLLRQVVQAGGSVFMDDYLQETNAAADLKQFGVSSTAMLSLFNLDDERTLFFFMVQFDNAGGWGEAEKALLETAARSLRVAVTRQQYLHLMEKAATTDPLTGLLNRRTFNLDVQAEISRCGRQNGVFSLLNIDLDGLKGINDQQGHHRGDELIQAFGMALREVCRKEDRVYRLGGDEFMVLLPGVKDHAVTQVVQKAIELLKTSGFPEADASVGFVSCPADGWDFDTLTTLADRRMYQHKATHKTPPKPP